MTDLFLRSSYRCEDRPEMVQFCTVLPMGNVVCDIPSSSIQNNLYLVTADHTTSKVPTQHLT